MSNQGNYKRTVAGSVGAGMGAIFNGSGRTYYILEHKTQSQYHNIGESQKIIIDQIELGRASSCQVRWEDTSQFEMVSRRHAAIVRDGNNWELIHLSTSNPTLVNGRPIQGHYYLQSGDEIQLAVGGPRMGFIVPQGKQAMTSSIRLTERMNLFRQQALAPYKKALWAMAALLLLVVIGFGAWNYKLSQDNEQLMTQAKELLQQQIDLNSQITLLEKQIKDNPDNETLKKNLEELKQRSQQIQTRYTTIYRDNPEMVDRLRELEAQVGKKDLTLDEDDEDDENEDVIGEDIVRDDPVPITNDGASDDVNDYRNAIYTLEIQDIQIGYQGNRYSYNRDVKKFVVGTGFIVDGTFYTARSNIDPWMYREYIDESWRKELAQLKAMGCDIYITYNAYSANGTHAPISFTSDDVHVNRSGDITGTVTIEKDFYHVVTGWGIPLASWRTYKKEIFNVEVYSSRSHNIASIYRNATGIPADRVKASSLKLGDQIAIAGYEGRQDKHNLGNLRLYDYNITTAGGYLALQGEARNSWGYVGSPAFFKGEDGKYRVIGVFVGNFNGECRVVPIR